MDAQVNFKAQEQTVEGFVNALQELKAMMKSLNDLPFTRLKGVEKSIVTPMQEAVGKLAETGTAMVNQFKQIGQKSGEALEVSAKSSIAKATTQIKQALAGHYGALGNFISTASAELKAKTDKATAAALMLDTDVVRQATQQSVQAMSGHYSALGVYIDARSKELQAKAEANQAALARAYAKLGSLATGDTGARMLTNPTSTAAGTLSGKNSGVQGRTPTMFDDQIRAESTALKNHLTELERVANLKAQIKKRIETSDVGFKPTARVMTADQRDAQYSEAMGAMRAHYGDAQGMSTASSVGLSMGTSASALKATTAAQSTLHAATLQSVRSTGQQLDQIRTLSDAFRLHTNVTNELHSAYRGLASGFGALWLTWGSALPLLAGAAVSNAITQSVRKGAEVTHTMAVIQHMGEVGVGQMVALNAQMLELGRTSIYGPKQVAEAMQVLTLAGVDAADMAINLQDVLNFALVGQVDAKAAAETLKAVAEAYGYSDKAFSAVGDVIAKTAATSLASVTDMMEAFKTSSVVAQQFGVTLQDTAAGLALLSNIGIKGSAAGTSFRNMITELLGGSKEAKKVIKDVLKLDIYDGNKLKPVGDILKQITSTLSGKTFEAQLKILDALGNERGAKSIAAYFKAIVSGSKEAGESAGQLKSKLEEVQQEIANAPGYSAMTAFGLSQTTQSQFKGLSASMDTALVEAFKAVQPQIDLFVRSMREVVNSKEFNDALQGLMKGLVDFAGVLRDNVDTLKTLAEAWVVYKTATIAGTLVTGAAGTALTALSAASALYKGHQAAAAATTSANTAAVMLGSSASVTATATTTALGTAAAATAAKIRVASMALGGIGAALTAAWVVYEWFFKEKEKAENQSLSNARLIAAQTEEDLDKEIERARIFITNFLTTGEARKAEAAVAEEAAVAKIRAADEERLASIKLTAQLKLEGIAKMEASLAGLDEHAQQGPAAVNTRKLLEGRVAEYQSYQREMVRSVDQGLANEQRVREKFAQWRSMENKKFELMEQERAKNRTHPTGPGGYDESSKSKSAKERIDAIKVNHFDELKQIEKRYNDEVSTIKSAEQNKQTLLKASHEAKLIDTGEFYARELALAAEAERSLLARAESSASAAAKAIEVGRDAVTSKFQSWVSENQSKDGFADRYLSEWERVSAELAKLDSEYESLVSKLANDKKTIGDNAATRMTLQAIKAEGAVKALAKETEDFWKAEATPRAAAQRATAAEDMLRYASPEAAAYISAATQEQERLTKAMLDNDKAVELAEVSLLAYAAALEMEWQVSKEQTAQLGLMADALSELKKRRDALAGKAPEMVSEAGDRALTKFKKDEKAQLIKGVADAIETGLFEGGTAGKKKLRDLIAAELRKPISLMIQAVVQPMMGALLGSMGMGSAAAGQAGGSMLGTAINGYSMYSNLASGAVGASIFGSSAAYASGLGLSSAAAGSQAAMLAAQTGSFGAAGLAATAQAAGTASTAVASAASAASSAASALAAAAPWIAGGLLVLNALGAFRTTKTVGGGLSGTLGSGDINSYDLKRKSGTLFSGPDYSIANMQKSAWSDMIQNDWKRATTSVVDMAKALNLSTEAANGFTAVLGTDVIHPDTGGMGIKLDDLRGKNLSEQQYAQEVQNRINEAILAGSEELAQKLIGSWTTTTETIAKQVQVFGVGGESTWETVNETVTKSTYTVSEYARSNETALQTLTRLATSLTTVNQTFDVLGLTLQEASLKGADAASAIVDAYGGIDTFGQLFGSFYENYYSEEEKRANSIRQITKELAAAGSELTEADIGKTTKAQFRAITEGIIETKGAADPLAVALMKVAPAFAEVAGAAEATLKALKDTGAGLQADLLEELGRKSEAAALRRKTDIIGMDAAAIAQYDLNNSLRDQIDAAKDAKDAAKELKDAQEKATEAAKQEAERVAQERDNLTRSLLEAIGDTAAIRALEIAALDASNRAIQTHVWAIEDAKAAYEKATDAAQAAYNTLERSVDAERTKLTTTYNAEKDAISARLKAQQVGYQAQITAAQAAADKIRDIASALAAAVNKVKVDSPALNRLAYDSARGVISTRNIDDPRLKAALDAVSGDNKQFYGTFEAYAFDQAVTSANIKSMDATAQSQLSAAEALINSMKASDALSQALADAELAALEEKHQEDLAKLQEQLDNGKAQLDALMGIDNSVLSVADAVAALGGAISAAYAAQSAQIAASSAAQSTVSSGSAETFVQSDDQAAYRALIDAQGKALNDAKGSAAFWESIGVDGEKGAALAASDRAAVAAGRYDRVGAADVLGLDGKAVNDAIYKYAVASNPLLFDSSAGAALSNAGSGYVPPGLRDELLKTLGIPGFDVGINRVPRDMLAQIHEGEAVVPAQFNPYNPGASAPGNSEVVAELRRLNERMARIEATNAATAGHTAATDRKLARVIRNDAMVTEALPA